MNLVFGIFSLLAVFFWMLRFRPRCAESRVLCLLTALTGVFGILAGEPIHFLYGLAMAGLQIVVCRCCYLRLRSEWRCRMQRRATQMKSRRACVPTPVQQIAG